MPLLATYTYAGAASLASGTNCFAHGLPTTPDWAVPIVVNTTSTAAEHSIPVHLVSRTPNAVIVANPNGTGVNAEMVAQFVHSLIR